MLDQTSRTTWTRLAIAALAALLCLAAAAPRSAQAEIRVFEVVAEGSGSYERYDHMVNPHTGESMTQTNVTGSFNWRTTLPRVSFDGDTGRLLGLAASTSGKLSGSAEDDLVVWGRIGEQVIRNPGRCVAAPQEVPIGGASVIADPAVSGGEPGAHLVLRPVSSVSFAASCNGLLTGFDRVTLWDGTHPGHAFDHHFFLPKLALDQGFIIQHVEQRPGQKADCAMRQPTTQNCSLTWSGKVTLRLVEVIGGEMPFPGEDDLVVPLEPKLDEDSLVEPLLDEDSLVVSMAKLAPDGSKASVKLSCPAGCAGKVSAYAVAAGGRAGASAKPRALASTRFKAPPGRVKTVTLRFRGAARAAARRSGAVRLAIAAGKRSRTVVARSAAGKRPGATP